MKNFILLLIIVGSIFLISSVRVNAQELGQKEPPLTVSNLTSVSFTISWFSDGSADQALLYGTQEPLDKWAVDDRGLGLQRSSHHVTIRGLIPETEYLFRVNDKGTTYKVKTAPKLTGVAPLPELFKGTVVTEDGTFPAESIVYLKIEGSQLLSRTTDAAGKFMFRTLNIRNADFSYDFRLKETNFVYFFARAGFEGEGSKQIYAFSRTNEQTIHLQELLIPFYKIQFPDGSEFAPEVVTTSVPSDAAPQPALQTASDESFFGIVWKRVRDIF
jgi:hypothetical protein